MTTGHENANRKPDCVVIDANIWRSQRLLKNNEGESIIYVLSRQGGFIGLPAIVERELTEHAVEAGQKAAKEITKASWILEDSSCDVPVPSEVELEKKVKTRISELEPILVRVPVKSEHLFAA